MKHRARFGSFLVSLIIISVLLCAYIFQDEFKARDFVLTGDLSTITNSLKLTDRANLILRAAHPALQEKEDFNRNCNSHSQEIYVLGCYREDQDRLYVYNVNSSELPGVREVTTAHEMLHAAYHRLLFWEKLDLKDQLQSVYDHLPADSDLRTSMQNYHPDEFYDELHSRIGTEVKDLPAPLERYYQRYFTDRQLIVKFNEQYHNVFTELQRQTDRLKESIEAKKQSIENKTKEYQTQKQQLNEVISDFNSRAARGDFSSQSDFNAKRQSIVSRIDALNREYDQLKQAIEELNSEIAKYNRSIYHNNELIDQINSNSIPKVDKGLSNS
jgi:hypothetical protein